MLRKTRLTLAALSFVAITLLLLDFTGALHGWLSWLAKVQFLPALMALNVGVLTLLIVLTLLFGRIYCSVICPLGIMQDLIARLSPKRRKNRYSYSRGLPWLRYGMLALTVVAYVLGVMVIVDLLAPYSAYGRIATMLLQPVYMAGNNLLAYFSERIDSYAFYTTDVWMKSLGVTIVAAVTLLLTGVLAWRGGRTWCNTVCPVGTVLGLFSRFSLLKVRFDAEKCRNCSMCAKACKSACIDYKQHRVDYSRCVACGNCLGKCKFGALSYALPKRSAATDKASADAPDASKRSFLMASALVTTAALAQEAKKVDGGLAKIEKKVAPRRNTPIAPPGAQSVENLAKRCTGCQLCVSKCPSGVLRPSGDWNHLMQPTVSYERGHCRPECNICSQVCPAGAINPITLEEKAVTQVGHAVWIKKNCVAVRDGVSCGNCERHCPVGAIEMVPLNADNEEGPWVPAINEARCIGCGACEHLCPARPFTAIMVEGHEQHKKI